MTTMINERQIAQRHRLLAPHLSDRELRLWAAAEATAHGPGAIAAVARATGLSPATIKHAQQELRSQPPAADAQRTSG
jgi:hypothetical protein